MITKVLIVLADKARSKLNGCKEKLLSFAGRESRFCG
ncbi:hypothetical protein AB3S75_015153 [Citrus x aurantiifolia]